MEKVPMLSQTFSQSNQTDQSRVTFQSHLLSTPWLASELGTSCLPCTRVIMNTVAHNLLTTAFSPSALLSVSGLYVVLVPLSFYGVSLIPLAADIGDSLCMY